MTRNASEATCVEFMDENGGCVFKADQSASGKVIKDHLPERFKSSRQHVGLANECFCETKPKIASKSH